MNEDEQKQWTVDHSEEMVQLWEAIQKSLEPLIEAFEAMIEVWNELAQTGLEPLIKAIKKISGILHDADMQNSTRRRNLRDRTYVLTPNFNHSPVVKLGKMYQYRRTR